VSTTTGAQPGRDGLDEATIHDVLGNDRRRLTIEALREGAGTVELGDLAEAVAARESGSDPAPTSKRQSVYVSLHQTHLPKLDSLGVVEYDTDRRDVRLLDRVEELEVYMEVVPEYGLSWGEFYLSWGVLGLLTVVAVRVDVPVVSAVGVTGVAGVFLLGVVAASAYHVYRHQEQTLLGRLS